MADRCDYDDSDSSDYFLIALVSLFNQQKNQQLLSFFRTFPTCRLNKILALQIIIPTLAPLINKIMQKEGTVKFFNETKGFGFITPSAGGQDVFVHSTGLIDEIRENDKVEFEVENGRKGLNAVNVKVI